MEGIIADFEIGGGWGNSIEWGWSNQWGGEITEDTRFSVHGWKQKKPVVGQTLKAEMTESWMLFEFTEIRPCDNPRDMFFATVKPIRQIMKPTVLS